MKKIIAMNVLVLLILSILSSMVYAESSSKIISVSLVNQDPDPAIAGEVVEVRLGIENEGSVAAENMILEVVPEYPFTIASGTSAAQAVGTIKAYQTGTDMKIVKFRLIVDKDATAGEYNLKVREYEEGKKSVSAQRTIALDIRSKESAEVIYIDKTTLIPGKEDTLEFTINNVGNAPLRDLSFSWINEDKIILPVGSDNTKYIKYIDVGESATLKYKVIADTNVDAGLYELSLQLTYDDPSSSEEKEINTIAGVYVGGGTDFDIAFSETSSGETSFTIANIGSNPAFSVSVIIPQQDGWRVSGSNSMIIGNLNTGDYTVASFGLQSAQIRQAVTGQQRNMSQQELSEQRSNMQTQNTLKIQIAYTDTRGQRELVEKEVTMDTQSLMASMASTTTGSETTVSSAQMSSFRRVRQQSFFSKYKWYIAVLVVLVIFGAGFWRYRKEKSLNPHYKVKDLLNIKALFKKKSKTR